MSGHAKKTSVQSRPNANKAANFRFIRQKRAQHATDAPKGAQQTSPGQRPGEKRDSTQQQALKGRYKSRAGPRHEIAVNERFVWK
jgi:hypothetical protein